MIFDSLIGLFSNDLAIDLGTANTVVFVRGKGIVLREPSVVAIHNETKEILAVGSEAKQMLGRTPGNIVAIRPMRDGVIANFEITEAMIKHFIRRVHNRKTLVRPRVVIAVPSGITQVEKRAVRDSAISAGAREVYLMEEPMAAAIGVGLPISNPIGNMIVDVGGGTTEVAVISLSGIVYSKSVRVAGDEMDEAIINYVRLKYSLLIGQPTAETVKINIGSGLPGKEKFEVVRGRDLENGLPKSIKISSGEIREALSSVLNNIIELIDETVEEIPPELIGDVLEQGITLAGGGALISGIDKAIAEAVKMPVWIAEDPLTCVVRGAAKLLEDAKLLDKLKVTGGLK